MRFLRRSSAHRVSRSPGPWLTLLLSFVVLVPSVGLWWFMQQAVQNERMAARQKLVEAYRAQLASGRLLLAANWTEAADQLAAELATQAPGPVFAQSVHRDLADAIICLDAEGAVIYPAPPPGPRAGPDRAGNEARGLELTDPAAAAAAHARLAEQAEDAEIAARAWLAHARSLLRTGDKSGALVVLDETLQDERFRDAHDEQGRLLVPNADLLAFELAREIEPAAAPAIRRRLEDRLRDYDRVSMPSAQRLFLGRTLQRLESSVSAPRWLDAESLAAEYLDQTNLTARSSELRPTTLDEVWQHASTDGRVILLHRAEHLPVRLLVAMGKAGLPAGQRVDFVPPGREPVGALVSMPAGDPFPGWRIVLTPQDPAFFDIAASDRAASYAWIVGLVVVTIVVFAALAWGLVRRQIALTQLRNDLVANVTHELKTPLASMRLLVETLLHAPRLDEKTTREYLQLIATENLRLSRLIGNFLTFSRIERNKYTFDFRTVPASELVEGAAAAVRDRFQGPEQRLEVDASPDLPTVNADPDALTTALVNLLDNAWKYTGESKHVVLQAAARNGSVVFAVRDNGIGMEPQEARRIFDRFYQVRQSQAAGGGAGLGLSIVQFVVQAHRGNIEVQSTTGRGSTFTITLPAAERTPPPA